MSELSSFQLNLDKIYEKKSSRILCQIKVFVNALAPFLFKVHEEAIKKGEPLPTMQQRLSKLIPKANKNKLRIENWRPISLLNNDAKIFAFVFNKILKTGLDDIIAKNNQALCLEGIHVIIVVWYWT